VTKSRIVAILCSALTAWMLFAQVQGKTAAKVEGLSETASTVMAENKRKLSPLFEKLYVQKRPGNRLFIRGYLHVDGQT
jgi:hypothetical protein